jgi:hypothetical protein
VEVEVAQARCTDLDENPGGASSTSAMRSGSLCGVRRRRPHRLQDGGLDLHAATSRTRLRSSSTRTRLFSE